VARAQARRQRRPTRQYFAAAAQTLGVDSRDGGSEGQSLLLRRVLLGVDGPRPLILHRMWASAVQSLLQNPKHVPGLQSGLTDLIDLASRKNSKLRCSLPKRPRNAQTSHCHVAGECSCMHKIAGHPSAFVTIQSVMS